MFKLFIILAIIVAVLLILIVLIQNSKGGGLSSQFGGGGAQQMIGVKKTTDVLEKATWIFIVALFVFSLSANLNINSANSGQIGNPNVDAAQQSLPSASPIVPADTTGASIEPVPADTSGQE